MDHADNEDDAVSDSKTPALVQAISWYTTCLDLVNTELGRLRAQRITEAGGGPPRVRVFARKGELALDFHVARAKKRERRRDTVFGVHWVHTVHDAKEREDHSDEAEDRRSAVTVVGEVTEDLRENERSHDASTSAHVVDADVRGICTIYSAPLSVGALNGMHRHVGPR